MKHCHHDGKTQRSHTGPAANTRRAIATLLCATIQLAAPTVLAEPPQATGWDRFYLGVGYAVNYAPNDQLKIFRPADSAPSTAEIDYDLGFRAASLGAGFGFAGHWRAELEAGYRRNEMEIIEFTDARGVLNTGFDDSVEALTGFANLYYEFAPALAIRPYLGIGLGLASTRYQTSFERPGFDFSDNTPLFDECDTALAWQLMAGASITLTARTRLSAEYRYWRTGTLNFSADSGPGGAQETFKTRHALHMAGVQLQYFPGASRDNGLARHFKPDTADSQAPRRYITARFGIIAAEDSDLQFASTGESTDTNFDAFDLGAVSSLAIGTALPSWRRNWPMRLELEATRFSNEAEIVDFGRLIGEYRLTGETTVHALAINLLVDHPLRNNQLGLAPYFGLGLGYARFDYDIFLRANQAGPGSTEPGVRARPGAAPGNPPGEGPNPATRFMDDRTNGALIQALLGINIRLSKRLDASLGYRYWFSPSLDLRSPDGITQHSRHSAHAIELGLRIRGPQRNTH